MPALARISFFCEGYDDDAELAAADDDDERTDGIADEGPLLFFPYFRPVPFLSLFPSLVPLFVHSFGRPAIHAFLSSKELGCDCGGGLRG